MQPILNNLYSEGRKSLLRSKESLRIDNIILGKTLYTMKDSDKVFTDMNFCLILLENAYGFSYFQGEIDYTLMKYVNKNLLDIPQNIVHSYMKVAVIDAMYCILNRNSVKKKHLIGNIRDKAKTRAKLLLKHIPKNANILLLGASTEIIEEANSKNCKIRVYDLEEQKIGLNFYSRDVFSAKGINLIEEIKKTDYIIATGMIFVTETADEIFTLVKNLRKNLTLYMESGSNFGLQLIKNGANVVLSEFFPYYDFFGKTKYSLFKARKNKEIL